MTALVDGQGRSDVLSLPKWTLFVRIAQLVLAFILLVITAYAASKLGSGAAGFGLTWFTFIFTVLYFVWLGVSLTAVPSAYHPIAHLPVEILLNIFWLSSWAVLASEATSIGDLEHYLGSYKSLLPSGYRNALNCVKAAAALGALEWVLFCITLAFLVIAFMEWHKNSAVAGAGIGGAGVGGAKADAELQNYNNGGAPPPGGVPAGYAQEPYGQVDPNAQAAYAQQQQAYSQQPQQAYDPNVPQQQQAYPEQGYADPNQPQQYAPASGQEVPPVQQYQEQPVTGAPPPQQQHPNNI
ncbi:hypothetical protein Sste5346_002035 [Sporothrix stenoceras]|uniref:MARVEL domain-containing protein n=1 Tax=Sporothrix stenoceras TaxID=5173 RepID=A0ABR3ZMB1_9PEZI